MFVRFAFGLDASGMMMLNTPKLGSGGVYHVLKRSKHFDESCL
jgi:hypothetical protein